MAVDSSVNIQSETKAVRTNGIDIHYREAGEGPPLLLLHGGAVSTNPLWTGHPVAYVSHVPRLAQHFRVIAPDTRGCGRTVHPGGPISFDLLADDVLALVDALRLNRPAICGFSEGGLTATVAAIRQPGSVHALVNDAGFDMLNPEAASFRMMRQMLGGSPDARSPDPDSAARFFGSSPELQRTFDLIQRDQDGGQGAGYWRTYFRLAFERTTSPTGYSFDDLRKITAPTLIVVGDRDQFCTVEDAVAAFRRLSAGELAVLPGVGHVLPPAAIEATLAFLLRH